MYHIRKRITVVSLCLLLMFLLTACWSGLTSAPAQDNPEGSGEVKLNMWAHQGQEKEVAFYKKRIQEFNEAYKGKINVNLQIIPSGAGHAYEDKINAAVTSGGLPDILDMDGPFVANYAATRILAPLDEYIDETDKKDFASSIIQQGTYEEKLYALGAMESSLVLFYNKKLLKEAGITPPDSLDKAWTWQQFVDNAKKLSKEGRYGVTLNMNLGVGEWMTFLGSVFVWSNEGELLAPDKKKAEGYVNAPASVEALQFIHKLFADKSANISDTPTDFEEGRAAMSIQGPWIIQGFDKYKDLDWGMTYLPYSKQKVSASGSWAFGISAQTKHPKEAAEVVKWMTNKESAVEISKQTGMPPARESAFKELPQYNELPLKVIKDQVLNTAHARPATPAYPVLSAKFAEAYQAAAMGQNVKEALDKTAQETDRELQRFNR
ncbi:hypothetical protein AM501_06995 [Aneurinibacillus migulanus]|uniref:ABC transporter substrate-binding protein n=1 Tax=Aneurinibacillus migulanus TaxID=47500 RepID=UPI0005BC2528|nr:sugar ABC transporter substrate-binding protein [Aneurinibacillus migulanus]KIV53781.1 hypothetical protein TS64_17800 [Aneurinibacillus migulanus]KPD08859.1 hypothetical protein AM501_06995 [Aneurinibacillus migulanus]MCP1356884.1 sugar ABC transporter substrate-binding protein [Aneurinibacillus migulanus]CEH30429.1 Putative substrate-binding protein MsmE [Aneurinibacillus migulanus]